MEQNQQIHDDLQDRLMDLALRRKFGAERACDLSEEIGSVDSLRATPLMSRTWFRLVIAASVMVAVGWAISDRSGDLSGHPVAVVDESFSVRQSGIRPGQWETTTIRGLASDVDDETGDEDSQYANETIIQEGTTVVLDVAEGVPTSHNNEIAQLRSMQKRLQEVIKNQNNASRQSPNGVRVSAGPAGGIQVNADGTVTALDGAQGGIYSKNTTRGAQDSRDGIVVYNLPASGPYNYDRGGMTWTPRTSAEFDSKGFRLSEPGESKDLHVWINGAHDDVPMDGYSIDLDQQGRDRFACLNDNRFLAATENPLSTFSIDVDTASYSVVRSRIENRINLPPEAVRVEELVNYFSYSYPQPTDGAPFAVHVDVAACPWAAKHRLVRIGLKGKEIAKSDRPASNLVFLVDVSGSMSDRNKLDLVKHGLLRLVGELDERDRVAIVVYAGNSGCVLASTPCTQANKERIRSAIGALQSGGSTNGEAGIQLAYQIAQDHFVKGGANRVILCTDGDFNVGTTSDEALKQLVAERAKSGVFLTALGFGMGNHNDQMLEAIADNGNGTYGYIDDQREVEKLFVRDLSGTLVTIAKDVKIQVEFNPAEVGAYRLIGYENRILAKEDFNNDNKDAGDIGAGHTVTALYEIVPPAALAEASRANAAASEGLNGDATGKAPSGVDALEFQRPKQELELTEAAKNSGDLLLVKLRYKAPDGDTSTLIKTPAKDNGATFAAASSDFKFAASVAAFGMILRQSPFRGDITLAAVEEIAAANRGDDENNQRREFVALVQQLRALTGEEGRGARD